MVLAYVDSFWSSNEILPSYTSYILAIGYRSL